MECQKLLEVFLENKKLFNSIPLLLEIREIFFGKEYFQD